MSREELEAAFGNAVRAYQTGVDNFDQAVADHIGINRTDGRCIDLIDQAGGMTAGELAKAAGLTTGAVTAVIDRLEKAGVAQRVADPKRPAARAHRGHAEAVGVERADATARCSPSRRRSSTTSQTARSRGSRSS